MVASMPPKIGFSFSFFLATNAILLLINFHYSFFISFFEDISPIPKLFILSLSFLFHESSNKKQFLKVTLKQQTDYLYPNLIPKQYFYFTFPFFDVSQTGSFVYHFRPRDFFMAFCKRKQYLLTLIFQTENIINAHQPLVSLHSGDFTFR